jgi:uncharacterized protein (DUF305 family)
MIRVSYLVAGLVLAVLFVAVGGMGFVIGQTSPATDENATDSSTSGADTGSMMDSMMGSWGGNGTGSMMNGGGMMGSPMMSSLDKTGKPFDLQFIDEMVPHHEGALMSSEHMISNSKRPELRQLYENIQKSQSEQIEQMQEWRKEWYPDAGQASEMMGNGDTGSMMGNGMMSNGMMSGSVQGMMGGNALDTMFLKMMIPHHQMAVDMSDEALSKAEHPELRDLAQNIRDEQSSEIELMKGYLNESQN